MTPMKSKMRLSLIFHVIITVIILAIMMPALPVIAAPSITASPSSGVSGTTVTITGTSFNSYIGDQLSIFLNDAEVKNSTITISATGALQAIFQIPDYTSPGSYIISVKWEPNITVAQCQFTIFPPEIVLNKWGGIVGTVAKASCRGFAAGKEVTIQYYSIDSPVIISRQIANNMGECTSEFAIPASPSGSNKITAQDALGDTARADFIVIPSVTIEPSIGAVGDKVSIIGTGFTPGGEAEVTLYGKKVAYARIYEMGSFCATFYVPVIKAGNYTILVEDPYRNKKWIDFTVDARITLSKSSGEVGVKSKISGTGFEVNTLVDIEYDLQWIGWSVTDNTGAFFYSIDIPISLAGVHVITATDGFNIRQATFTMENEAPPAPKPAVPKRNARVEARVSLDWESVYDPSEPLTYTLQIARTADFSNPIIEKTGLTASQYTLTEEEALQSNRRFSHYYWRVQAIDGASNVGEWSEPVAFHVNPTSTLPIWAKYLIGMVGVLIIILMVYRIRKTTAVVSKDTVQS